jgi:hypothetical protein
MRFEAHVDSNPVSGVLFCTDHPEGGGELVISHDPAASGVAAIERDRTVIRPHAGHLLFFDGRDHPHYARPLTAGTGLRVLAVMNYYTESFPESTRPRELNHHLYGDPGLSTLALLGTWATGGGTVTEPLYRQIAQDLKRFPRNSPPRPGISDLRRRCP